jgi:hypothetical protein
MEVETVVEEEDEKEEELILVDALHSHLPFRPVLGSAQLSSGLLGVESWKKPEA